MKTKRTTKAEKAVLATQEKALTAAAHCAECGGPTRLISDASASYAFCPICHGRRLRDQAEKRLELKREREQEVKPLAAAPAELHGTCLECGGPRKFFKVLSFEIGVCPACRDRGLELENQRRLQLKAKEVQQALDWARLPLKYQAYSLADVTRIQDWRGRQMPARSVWPDGVVMISSQAEYDLVKRLRNLALSTLEGWVLVEGPPGQGKTLLVAAWLGDQVRAGLRGALWLSEREFSILSAAEFGSFQKKQADELLEKSGRCKVLVWDDLGFTGNGKLFANVLGLRYERALPTLITTNLTASQRTKLLDGPTSSRLAEMCRKGFLVQLDGPDKRRDT